MEEQNKLKIYQFIIGKRHSSERVENDALYEKFYSGRENSTEQIFSRISTAFYESFNGEFKKDKKGNRAISITNDNLIDKKSNQKIIHGFLNGGITDTDFKQFAITDSKRAENLIKRDQVLGQDYYFLIYIPEKTNIGFVFLQYNDSVVRGVSSAFFEHFEKFLSQYGFKINYHPYCPKKIINNFVDGSAIIEIEFIQQKRTSERDPLHGEITTYKLSRKLGGINIPYINLNTFLFSGVKLRKDVLCLLGMADEEDLKISVNYKKGTKTRKANISNQKLIPDIDIKKEYIDSEKTKESLEKMFDFASKYLDLIMEEVSNLNYHAIS